MPLKLPYVLLKQFSNNFELESFLLTIPNCARLTTNTVNCQICKNKDHKMKQTYLGCASLTCNPKARSDILCPVKFKLEMCQKNSKNTCKIRLWQLNDHVDSESKHEPSQVRGIDKIYKKLIEKIILRKNIATAKLILIEISRTKYRKKLQGLFPPTMEQIKNYLSYRRRKLGTFKLIIMKKYLICFNYAILFQGDRNNIEDCLKFVKKHLLDDQEDDLFFFGEKYDSNNKLVVQ